MTNSHALGSPSIAMDFNSSVSYAYTLLPKLWNPGLHKPNQF